ncbi:unnamed protein product [Cuscuta campestris]|uniref:O-fucosyltransferase family protein n=1 Tax=Cuscuta campestris TaxID=132261 RepID=A0A484LBZ9_9ASTE|nr:unnamed protein product [Cuscuta campestris]
MLQGDVRIIRTLPRELESVHRARKHFTSWSSKGYYTEMKQLWKENQVIHVAKSDSRLANNDLPLDIQRLRCRALYHALRFSPPIESLGKKLVERLRLRASRYIALHLRYEKDMLSFTGCTYGLADKEAEELRVMRPPRQSSVQSPNSLAVQFAAAIFEVSSGCLFQSVLTCSDFGYSEEMRMMSEDGKIRIEKFDGHDFG